MSDGVNERLSEFKNTASFQLGKNAVFFSFL